MKLLVLTILVLLYSNQLQAQQVAQETTQGKITFDQDETNWIASVYQKDTINILYKMQFETVPTQTPPKSGIYRITRNATTIGFYDVKRRKDYVFTIGDIADIPARKGLQRWAVAGIGHMNPVCFPSKNATPH